MPHLDPLPWEANPQFRERFQHYQDTRGFVPNSILTMQRRPAIAQAFMDLNRAVLYEGTVSEELKMLVSLITSQASGCRYCQAHMRSAAISAESAARVSDGSAQRRDQPLRIARRQRQRSRRHAAPDQRTSADAGQRQSATTSTSSGAAHASAMPASVEAAAHAAVRPARTRIDAARWPTSSQAHAVRLVTRVQFVQRRSAARAQVRPAAAPRRPSPRRARSWCAGPSRWAG